MGLKKLLMAIGGYPVDEKHGEEGTRPFRIHVKNYYSLTLLCNLLFRPKQLKGWDKKGVEWWRNTKYFIYSHWERQKK